MDFEANLRKLGYVLPPPPKPEGVSLTWPVFFLPEYREEGEKGKAREVVRAEKRAAIQLACG